MPCCDRMMIAHKTDRELPALWHGAVDRFTVKVRFEVVKRQISHGLAGLARRTSDVRSQDYVGNRAQGFWYVGLVFKHIQTSTCDDAVLEGVDQSFLVDHGAARDVDQNSLWA